MKYVSPHSENQSAALAFLFIASQDKTFSFLPIDLLTAVWYNYPISLVDPETHFDYFNTQLTDIDAEKVKNAPNYAELWKKIEPIMNRLCYAVTPNLR